MVRSLLLPSLVEPSSFPPSIVGHAIFPLLTLDTHPSSSPFFPIIPALLLLPFLPHPPCSPRSPSVLTHQFVSAFPFSNSSGQYRSKRLYIIRRYRSCPHSPLLRFFVFPVPFPHPIMKLDQIEYQRASQWNPVL